MTLESTLTTFQIEAVDPTAEEFGTAATPLAPRPSTLTGAVVGLLSNSKPNAEVALRAVGAAIQERFDDVEVRYFAGSIRFEPDLLRRAIEESDVLVGTAADCGACTSWLIHDGAQAEKAGVPQVTIVARGFEHDAESSAKVFGVPELQYVVVPRVYTALSPEVAIEQSLPVVDEIVALLTSDPASRTGHVAVSKHDGHDKQDVYRFDGPDALEVFSDFNRYFLDNEMGDGYPLLPPTPERVDALVAGNGGDPDALIVTVPPAHGHGTVGKIAANAALAGCLPEELPVVFAALKAIYKCPPPMNLSVLMSTGAFAPAVMVNGPIVKKLGLNGGRDPLGPGRNNEVNLRIGRAIALCLRNLGQWIPGVMDLDTIGTIRKHINVWGENEDETPWEPYHVSRGYRPDDNTVTVIHTVGEWDLGSHHGDADMRLHALAGRSPIISQVGFMTTTLGGLDRQEDGLFYLLPPETAKCFADAGLSKKTVEAYLTTNIRPRISDVIAPYHERHLKGKIKREWRWLFELSPEEQRSQTIQAIREPEMLRIAVAGSGTPKDFVFGIMTAPITEPIVAAP